MKKEEKDTTLLAILSLKRSKSVICARFWRVSSLFAHAVCFHCSMTLPCGAVKGNR